VLANGNTHQKITPSTPQQNGVAERVDRTLIKHCFAFLADTGPDSNCWEERTLTVDY